MFVACLKSTYLKQPLTLLFQQFIQLKKNNTIQPLTKIDSHRFDKSLQNNTCYLQHLHLRKQ